MKQYIVDAFTDELFKGNQAAVCVLEKWPSDELMQNIAKENNFSETAFTVKDKENGFYNLRWFTPGGEIDFCGHATLGTAFTLFSFYEKNAEQIKFKTQIGKIIVEKHDDFFQMDFPAYKFNKIEVTDEMAEAVGTRPLEAYIDRDLMLVLKDSETVKNLNPSQDEMKNLDGLIVIVTAKSDDKNYDCISRVFAPKLNIKEDPVTGSSHCMIVPYWCERLKKNNLVCYQASERTGILYASQDKNRIKISGKAVLYSECELNILM